MNIYNLFLYFFEKGFLFNAIENLADYGVFINDLHFFYFEFYFLFSIVFLLVFFVFLSNKKGFRVSYYLDVSKIFVNLIPFVVLILILLVNGNTDQPYLIFGGFYYNDFSITLIKNLLLVTFLFFTVLIHSYILRFKSYDFEFILILLISLFSSILILNSNDLTSLFFIIELQSLTFYILVSSKQTSSFSTESGLKYFILGCFSSGIILFGISLIYGFTGLLSFNDLTLFLSSFQFIQTTYSSVFSFSMGGFIIGFLFITVGIFFKLGSVPFHM